MSRNFKKPKALKTPAIGRCATAWDAEFSPLCLHFHYADPARGSRILVIGPAGREVVAETSESIASYKEFLGIDPAAEYAGDASTVLGSAARIRLPWADALAFLYRAEGTIVPLEKRIPIHFQGENWVLSGWAALDAGLVRTNITWEPLSDQELTAFAAKVGFASWSTGNIGQMAGIVMGQYQNDIMRLVSSRPSNITELQHGLQEWVRPALMSLPCMKEELGMTTINSIKLFQRAYEMMAYDYSSVDPTEPTALQYFEVDDQQVQIECLIGAPPEELLDGA